MRIRLHHLPERLPHVRPKRPQHHSRRHPVPLPLQLGQQTLEGGQDDTRHTSHVTRHTSNLEGGQDNAALSLHAVIPTIKNCYIWANDLHGVQFQQHSVVAGLEGGAAGDGGEEGEEVTVEGSSVWWVMCGEWCVMCGV